MHVSAYVCPRASWTFGFHIRPLDLLVTGIYTPLDPLLQQVWWFWLCNLFPTCGHLRQPGTRALPKPRIAAVLDNLRQKNIVHVHDHPSQLSVKYIYHYIPGPRTLNRARLVGWKTFTTTHSLFLHILLSASRYFCEPRYKIVGSAMAQPL